MLKAVAARSARGHVLLIDSITQLSADDAGAIVVCGSHGGVSSAHFALAWPLWLVVFNDAGVGKDGAGIAALALLQQRGVAAASVRHDSARIGDALDAWQAGVLSHLNAAARQLGLAEGEGVAAAVRRLLSDPN